MDSLNVNGLPYDFPGLKNITSKLEYFDKVEVEVSSGQERKSRTVYAGELNTITEAFEVNKETFLALFFGTDFDILLVSSIVHNKRCESFDSWEGAVKSHEKHKSTYFGFDSIGFRYALLYLPYNEKERFFKSLAKDILTQTYIERNGTVYTFGV